MIWTIHTVWQHTDVLNGGYLLLWARSLGLSKVIGLIFIWRSADIVTELIALHLVCSNDVRIDIKCDVLSLVFVN